MPTSSHLLPQHTPSCHKLPAQSVSSVPNPLSHIRPWLLTALSLQFSFQCHNFSSGRTSPSLQIAVGTTSLLTPSQCLWCYHRNFLFRDQCPQWDGDFLPFSPPLHHAACGIIVPQPGIKPRPLGSEGTCDIMCAQWVSVLKQRRPGCTRTGFRLLFKCQQVAKSKLPFQKLQHGKHVGILLVGGKMVHLTYDSWKTGIKRSWPFLSFKAWRTLPSRGGRQSCWNMSFVVLNGVRRLHLHKARRMARFSE